MKLEQWAPCLVGFKKIQVQKEEKMEKKGKGFGPFCSLEEKKVENWKSRLDIEWDCTHILLLKRKCKAHQQIGF